MLDDGEEAESRLTEMILEAEMAHRDAAIERLEPMWPYSANDPARLINLGNAYAGAGRMKQAREAYRSARFAPEMMLLLANGEEESSRVIARRAMGRLNPSFAAR